MREINRLRFALECLTEGASAESPRGPGTKVLRSDRFRDEAQRVCRDAGAWIGRAGIQGFGVGPREVRGKATEELAVRVYVDRKKPRSECPAPVPSVVVVGELGDIPIDVVEVGRIKLEGFTGRDRPANPGVSVAHLDGRAGTLGLVVRREGQEGVFLLSCAHVVALDGTGHVGDPVLQPAIEDGGIANRDTLGRLSAYQPFAFTRRTFPNHIDAALARVTREDLVEPLIRQLALAPVKASSQIREGTRVRKVGRTTDLTTGQVVEPHFKMPVRYRRPGHEAPRSGRPGHRRRGRVGFSDLVLCTRYSARGDSGAAVLDDKDRVVGLHMAGSESKSVFCRFDIIARTFGLELVGQI